MAVTCRLVGPKLPPACRRVVCVVLICVATAALLAACDDEPVPTATTQPTNTPTPLAASTPTPSVTLTSTPTATATATPTPEPTATPTPEPTATPTPEPTATPTPEPTATPTPEPTATPTPEPTATPTPEPTATPTPEPTATPTPEPTATPTPEPTATPTPEPTATPTPEPTATPGPLTSPQIFDKVSPSIAFIETVTGTGSGVLIDGGYVVTNAHVVWPFDTVRVVFPDGSEFHGVPVNGWDLLAGLAVLGPIDAPTDTLALVDGESWPIGTDMFLIGYPGEVEEFPQPTIARGLLSRVREWESIGITYLQTDAPVIGGQSGGAAVSNMGEVIGISGLAFTEGSESLHHWPTSRRGSGRSSLAGTRLD